MRDSRVFASLLKLSCFKMEYSINVALKQSTLKYQVKNVVYPH